MKKGQLFWANDLRAVTIIAVIVLHVASTISISYPGIPTSYFVSSLFIDSAVRWCVPVFIMLSGSFALQQYDGRLKAFLIKMFHRIILPFLFWSIVYLFFFSWYEMESLAKAPAQLFSFIGKQFLIGTASHLWYVYLIISMYLTFPFLSKWAKGAVEKEYFFFVALWVIYMLITPYLTNDDISFDFSFFSGYIGYIILGNYLFKTTRKVKQLWLFAIFITAFLYTALRSYFISDAGNEMNEVFMENLSINICMMSSCIYLLIKNKPAVQEGLLRKLVDIICLHSYGIYLSHLLVLNIFLRLGLSFYFIHPLLSIPLITIVCLVISCLLIIQMKKIPLLRFVAG